MNLNFFQTGEETIVDVNAIYVTLAKPSLISCKNAWVSLVTVLVPLYFAVTL